MVALPSKAAKLFALCAKQVIGVSSTGTRVSRPGAVEPLEHSVRCIAGCVAPAPAHACNRASLPGLPCLCLVRCVLHRAESLCCRVHRPLARMMSDASTHSL